MLVGQQKTRTWNWLANSPVSHPTYFNICPAFSVKPGHPQGQRRIFNFPLKTYKSFNEIDRVWGKSYQMKCKQTIWHTCLSTINFMFWYYNCLILRKCKVTLKSLWVETGDGTVWNERDGINVLMTHCCVSLVRRSWYRLTKLGIFTTWCCYKLFSTKMILQPKKKQPTFNRREWGL